MPRLERGVAGIRMPDERSLPPGPLRELTRSVHELYRAAGRPPVREVARRILDNANLHGTASHESVRAVLNGRLTRWEVLEAVGHELALMAHPPQDPNAVAEALIQEWNRANEVAEGDPVTAVTGPPKTASTKKGQAYTGEVARLLDDMDQVLEQNADEFIAGFVQGRGGVDVESVEEILERFPQLVPPLVGEVNEPPLDLFIDLLVVLLMLLTGTPDAASCRTMVVSAVESSRRIVFGFTDVPELLRELQSRPRPADVIDRYLSSADDVLVRFVDNWCDQDPQLVLSFQESLTDLIHLAQDQALGRSQQRQRSRRVTSAERTYRHSVAAKMFDQAQVAFAALAGEDQTRANDLRQQTGFVWLKDRDRDVMAGLWSHLAVGNLAELAINDEPPSSQVTLELNKARSTKRTVAQTPVTAIPARRANLDTVTQLARSSSDLDPGVLLRSLFRLSEDQARELARQLGDKGRRRIRPC